MCWNYFSPVSNGTEETRLKKLSAKCDKIEIKVQDFSEGNKKIKKWIYDIGRQFQIISDNKFGQF